MEILKRLTILLFLLMCCASVNSQPSLPQNAPTPNAASLGKYGDVPISYYTGNPRISVPLYETSVRGVTLPIALEYDASGVPMNTLPSWTGYCWSLSAGGVITRKINGYPDELVLPANHSTLGFTHHNYFSCYNLLNSTSNTQLASMLKSNNDSYDLDADVFYFNFMGRTGKFFLGNDGQWKVNSDDNIDVIYQVGSPDNLLSPFIPNLPKKTSTDKKQSKTIAGFRLRDSEGVVYEFGYNTSAIEYTINFMNMGDNDEVNSWWATSWYLTKVTDRLGNVLYDFTYERGVFSAQAFISFQHTCYSESESGWGSTITGGDNQDFPFTIQLDAPVLLKEIAASNGVKISFKHEFSDQTMSQLYGNGQAGILYPNQWYAKIRSQLTSANTAYNDMPFYYLESSDFSSWHMPKSDTLSCDKLLERMGLYKLKWVSIFEPYEGGTYNIFKLTYSGSNQRMHLTEVAKTNHYMGSPRTYAKYSFEYDNYDKLPLSCLTTAVDHWGFYNGKTPYGVPLTLNDIINKRTPDSDKMKYGSLTKITYPTGGSTVLEYEPNHYSSVLSLDRQTLQAENGYGGGLRIKTITEYSDSTCTTMLKRRRFSYNIPFTEQSSGELSAKPMYDWENWVAKQEGGVSVKYSTYRYASIVPLSNSYGQNIGYSHVTETNEDGSSTTYHYHNISDGPMDSLQTDLPFNSSQPSPYDKFSERGYARGKLLTIIHRDTTGTKVARTDYKYRSSSVTDDWVSVANLSCRYGQTGANTYSYRGRKYKMYYKRYDLESKVDSLFYNDGTGNAITESYSYGDYNISMKRPFNYETTARLLRETSVSKGSQHYTEHYYYPMDKGNTTFMAMAQKEYYLPIITTTKFYNGTLIDSIDCSYSTFIINNVGHKLANGVSSSKKGQAELQVYEIVYTSTGQIKQFRTIGLPLTNVMWAYNDNYLMCKYQGPIYSAPTFSDNQIFNVNSLLQEMKKQSNKSYRGLFTGYTYFDSKNISSVTTENGITTFYNFNDRHQLDNIKDNENNFLKKFEYNFKNK